MRLSLLMNSQGLEMRYKIRFNLKRGPTYKMWKVEGPDGVVYYDPEVIQLTMLNCRLKSNRKTAERIYHGEHKMVCAWVYCEELITNRRNVHAYDNGTNPSIMYDPRINPCWVLDGMTNADNFRFNKIGSVKNKLFSIH